MANYKKKVVIFGAGEIGDLAHFYFTYDHAYDVAGFVVDDTLVKETSFKGLPVVPLSSMRKEFSPENFDAHVALSYMKLNRLREAKYREVKELGYALVSYVCSKSVTWPDLTIGDNCLILENQTIQPKVKIGNNVMIWSGNHLGHGCHIHDHAYLASHICISGYTVIGERSFVGVNATFRDYIEVGRDSFITMDASVMQNVPEGSVVMGAPGKILPGGNLAGEKIKKKYFNLD